METGNLTPARVEELLNSEKYLRLMLESSPEIILLLDADGRVAYCSAALLRISGISDIVEISGLQFQHLYAGIGDDDFVRGGIARFEEVKAGHKTVANDISIDFSGNGEVRQYTVQAAPMLNEQGNFDGVFAIYYDTTDLRNAEADERTHILLDATPLACSFWDADGNMLDCNEEALRMFGVSDKSEYLNHLLDLSPEYQPDGSLSSEKMDYQDDLAMETGYFHTEWLHQTLSGEPLPTEVTLVRVPWKDGYGLATYCRDLREVKATETLAREAAERSRELEIASRAAIVASEAKSSFLASMSHEIRTPMNAIIGMSDLIPTDNLNDMQLGYLDDIKKMSRALLNIIDDILDFSKIEAGKMELVPVHFNLMELYDNICSMSRFLAENKELGFRSSFDTNVPHVIFGDDTRIRQVIINLLNNAIKYTRKGFVELHVSLVDTNIAFKVKDTGIGIRREDFPKLFKTFQQLDLEENKGILGTGLGLSIIKNLVTMMSGEVTVESEYGTGSEFTFLLPLTIGDPKQIASAGNSAVLVATEDVRVLVADDNNINLKVAVAYLEKHNIHADTASGGREAIEIVQSKPFDLVFMDHMMPDIDGLEATREIRALGAEYAALPIVALSANAVVGARSLFLDAGMNDFISKPIDPIALNNLLLKWLPPDKITETNSAVQVEPQIDIITDEPINMQLGLRLVANDEDVYSQLLEGFVIAHSDDDAKIIEALNRGDTASAHRTAHTLKSVAAQIGAERLRNIAAAIEDVLTVSPPYLTADLSESLSGELVAVLAIVKGRDASQAVEPLITAEYNAEAATQLIERLEPLLKTGNAESYSMISEITQILTQFEPHTTRLTTQISGFAFADALITLQEIKKLL
jgi:PAS domain S-box-containing protein